MNGETKAFEWRDNNACVATYKVLEADIFLDQFEDTDIPFAKAASIKLKELRYFPKTTANPNIIEVLSLEIARRFLKHVIKVYTVKRQSATMSSADIISKIASVFANGEKTIGDLAQTVDETIKFPDEG